MQGVSHVRLGLGIERAGDGDAGTFRVRRPWYPAPMGPPDDSGTLSALRQRVGRWRGNGRARPTDLGERLAEIESLTAANRDRPDAARERELVLLRHRAGAELVKREHRRAAAHSEPVGVDSKTGLAEVQADQLSAELVRGAIETHGYLLVRGLVPGEVAASLTGGIEKAFAAREAVRAGSSVDPSFYDEFDPEPPYAPLATRAWIESGGAVAIADSPPMLFKVLEEYAQAGLLQVVGEYLGEPVVVSAQKCALRRTDPQGPGGWHQDGSFMGRVHALNLWLCLSPCGESAPGLDIVPRRLDGVIPTGGEGTTLPNQIAPSAVEEAAAPTGVLRPHFEPGDAMFFDDVFLHRTGAEEDMPDSRYAIECWFFGASGFPKPYIPLAA